MRSRLGFGVFLLLWLAPIGFVHANDEPAPKHRKAVNVGPTFELSAMGSLSKTDYGNNTYSTSRHYTGTFGYFLTSMSELELSYDSSTDFMNEDPTQTSTMGQQTLGLCLVQRLLPPRSVIEPYIKGGVGQINRQQNGTVAGIPTTPEDTKSPTGILGAGLRIRLYRGLGFKGEGVTYLTDFHMDEAPMNFSLQLGLSLEF